MKIKLICAGMLSTVVMLLCTGCLTSTDNNTGNDPVVPVSQSDSLFNVLVKQVQVIDSTASSVDGFTSMDFVGLRKSFSSIMKQSPDNQKANLGYMISALISLNSSTTVAKLADSLDAYFTAQSNYSSPTGYSKRLMHTAYQKEGIAGLGKVLATKSAKIMQAQTLKPSLPGFITLQYIQQIAENEVVPVLDTIIQAAQRLENLNNMEINLFITDNHQTDTFNVKKGEIYVVEALCHLTRAYLGMFCAYDLDLYAPQTTNYSWVDTLINSKASDSIIYSFSGDTLYELCTYNDAAPMVYAAKMFKYNLQRTGFMTIRKQNHAKAKADLIAVADCIKSGLSFVRNQSSISNNDIIKMSYINDADKSMLDLKTQMTNDGISPALAAKFASPENIADFVKALLSGPYTFNESQNGTTINLKVDLSAWFNNPVSDLRSLLPKYSWTSDNAWVVKQLDDSYTYTGNSSSHFDAYGNYAIRIPSSKIVSKTGYAYGDTTYVLSTPINHWATIDSSTYFDPLRLLDENNNPLTMDQVDSLVRLKTYFPCFADYTFHGVFPDMTTRQKWINLIYQ